MKSYQMIIGTALTGVALFAGTGSAIAACRTINTNVSLPLEGGRVVNRTVCNTHPNAADRTNAAFYCGSRSLGVLIPTSVAASFSGINVPNYGFCNLQFTCQTMVCTR